MKSYIDELWEVRDTLSEVSLEEPEIKKAILDTIDELDNGRVKVAFKEHLDWEINEWVQKAINLYFKTMPNFMQIDGMHRFFDNIPLKFDGWDHSKFKTAKISVLPGATVRKGCFVSEGSRIMSSFIDIGVHIGKNSYIGSFSTIANCSHIGNDVFIGNGVGIGGKILTKESDFLTIPTIIEKNSHIGAKSEIGAGVYIGEGSFILENTTILSYTKIYDKATGQVYEGQIPPYSIVTNGKIDGSDVEGAVILKVLDKNRSYDEIVEMVKEL